MDYSELLETLKNYYANLLIVQYHDKPKAVKTIKMLVELLCVKMILLQIRDAFDWKTASEAQLDIIGKWLNVDKFYTQQEFDDNTYFAFIDWNNTPNNRQAGFSDYSDLEKGNNFINYNNSRASSNKLDTNNFRNLIGLTIIYNNINHIAGEIDTAIKNYFSDNENDDPYVYTVWEHQENKLDKLIYYYKPEYSEILQSAYNKGVLPCPIGCSIELVELIQPDTTSSDNSEEDNIE